MKRKMPLIFAALFIIAGVARADSVVAVDLEPTQFTLLGQNFGGIFTETLGVTFIWDTTTNTLSDFQITAQGPIQGFSEVPTDENFSSSGLRILDFFDSQGDQFQLDSLIHIQLYTIPPTPGTYTSDLFFQCVPSGCLGQDFELGVAKVTAVPEPSSFSLIAASFLGLAALKLRRA